MLNNTTNGLIVVALGGNAISRKGEEGNVAQQFARTAESCEVLAELVARGHQIVVTHGNGPQVGSILRRVELAAHEVYPIPLYMCVADSQAGMGFMITQSLNNALARRGVRRRTSTVITSVEVATDDPAFASPTKPIGRYLSEAEARHLMEHYEWPLQRFDKNEYRIVVPSPLPRRILELDMIRRMVAQGEILVCCGGGGIPVARDAEGELRGVDAVVDKDRTTEMLASELGAHTLVIATAVNKVAINYRTPQEQRLDRLTVAEARRLQEEGHFAPGTMGPKVEAAINFVLNTPDPSAQAIITRLESVKEALDGKDGTVITR